MHSEAHARMYSVPRRDSDVDDPASERVGSKTDDETLVRETLAGKRWAQREVWYRFSPMVHGLLRRALSSRHGDNSIFQSLAQ